MPGNADAFLSPRHPTIALFSHILISVHFVLLSVCLSSFISSFFRSFFPFLLSLIFSFLFCFFLSNSRFPSLTFLSFWAAAPKGQCPVEYGGNFETSVLPHVPPHWPSRYKITPPQFQLSPPGLKIALSASNYQPPRLKSALLSSNLPSRP